MNQTGVQSTGSRRHARRKRSFMVAMPGRLPRIARVRTRVARRQLASGTSRRGARPFVRMFDALIVGGGPSGAALALRLRAARLRVAIVDRAAFPRDKPCGEGVLPTGVRVLRELGLGD